MRRKGEVCKYVICKNYGDKYSADELYRFPTSFTKKKRNKLVKISLSHLSLDTSHQTKINLFLKDWVKDCFKSSKDFFNRLFSVDLY